MLSSNNLKTGIIFLYNGQPHEVLESEHLKMAQRRPVTKTKLKNLINGITIYQNFQQSETFEEANVARESCKFLYGHRGEFWFCKANDPSTRFSLNETQVGESRLFLKPATLVEVLMFGEKPFKVNLPIKLDFKVTEAPPNIKGDTAQGGGKEVTIETGAKVRTPLFIETGDIIRVNTQTGEYAERMQKS